MKKTYSFLLFLFLVNVSLNAQEEYWNTTFSNGTIKTQRNSTIIEKDFSFVCISGKTLYENTYFLEARKTTSLPFVGSPLNGGYFYGTEIEGVSNSFYFAGQKSGDSADKIYLNTFDGANDFTTGFELSVDFDDGDAKGPAAVKVDEGNVVIFGNETFYSVDVTNTGELSLAWEKAAGYGLIADAKKYNDGYILCNEAGKLVHVDENADEVWVKDLGYELFSVLPVGSGFILGGSKNGNATLAKTDIEGNVIWEKDFGSGEALSVVRSHDSGLVFSGNIDGNAVVVRTDDDGEEVWNRDYGQGFGTEIVKSKFGGYLFLSKSSLLTMVVRLDEEGDIVEDVSDPQVRVLEVNNIRSAVTAIGQLFWNGFIGEDVNTSYPKGESTSVIFAGGLLISGQDQNNERLTSATQYVSSDFEVGPPMSNANSWNRVWRINKKYITRLREDIADGNIDSALPLDLWTYPGANNPNFNLLGEGQDVVPENFAPFVDVNNDGIYNILDGDYPEIKGDEMLWWVMHSTGEESVYGGNSLELEVRGVYYAFECEESDLLYNSTFLEFDIKNISGGTYSDLYLGTFIDFDHGCYLDDYIGSLPNVNSVFSYNSDAFDGSNGVCQGVDIFEDEIPIQSVTYLNNDLDHSIFYNNAGISPPPIPATTDPSTATEVLNYLQGKWRDGAPLTSGGNGYGGTIPVDFAFSGNPSNTNGWSMCSEDLPNGDRRMVMSSGPKTLASQEVIEFDLGMLTHEDIDHPCPNTSQIESDITELQSLYDNGALEVNLYLGDEIEFEPGETIILDAGPGGSDYEWSNDASTQTIEVTVAGSYSVTVTSAAGCVYTDEVTLIDVTSIAEVQKNAPKIYPNPTSSQIFIELQNDLPEYITLENTLGQNLQNHKIAKGVEFSTLELNVSNVPDGMYLLRFHYKEKGKMLLRKLVVAK